MTKSYLFSCIINFVFLIPTGEFVRMLTAEKNINYAWFNYIWLLRVSDVNSPVFLYFWFCYIKSQIFFLIFGFNKYGPSLHYPNLKKKLSHLDIGSLRGLLLFHTKISIIYENGSKFAVV